MATKQAATKQARRSNGTKKTNVMYQPVSKKDAKEIDKGNNSDEQGAVKDNNEKNESPVMRNKWNVNKSVVDSIRRSANKFSGGRVVTLLADLWIFQIAAWNVRGLGKNYKQNAVKELLIEEKLSICAILETRLKGPKVKRIGDKVFDQAMFCLIENLSTKERILCSFIHAEMEGRLRKKLWIDLNISTKSQDMEDFQDYVNNLKIDDVASNEEFFDIHKRAHVVFLPYGISDHSLAVLTCSKNMKAQTRAFRFANYVADKEEFKTLVEEKWNKEVEGFAMFRLVKKLKAMKPVMNNLNWKNGNLNEKVKKLKKALDDIQNSIDKDPYNDSLRKIDVDTLGEYSVALEDEEKLMFQRAQVQWMNEASKFYQESLTFCIGEDVCNAVEEFFLNGKLFGELNAILITLVPKCSGAIDAVTIARILNILPFKRGKLPVRYLGMPLIAKQLGVNDCKSLVDKLSLECMIGRIKAFHMLVEPNSLPLLSIVNQWEASKRKMSKVPTNKKDTLWVRWIHMIKLKGRSIWEVEKQCNDNSLWKSLMDLRNEVTIHMQYKIGFNNDTALADYIDNEGWKWPAQWFIDHPMLNQYPIPSLEENMEDKLMWCSNDGSLKNFSTSQVWNDTRRLNNKNNGVNVYGIPDKICSEIILCFWMASKEKLVTQDKLSKWYPNKSWKCPLCLKVEDSHKHLFFDCDYSNTVWIEVQKILNERDLNNLNECMHKLSCLPCKKSIWSIVRRLCIANTVYHIWVERNSRIFNQMSMSSSNTTQSIIKSVRSRLLTLKVKHTAAVVEVERKWVINLKNVPGFNPAVFHERVMSSVACGKPRNKGLALCFGNTLGNVAKWDVSLSDSYPRVVPRNGISALGVGSQCEQEFYPSLCDALYKSPLKVI
ncbi:RNA-directed DNA polymerase, eukaryota, reverse transcriptase zinc-binding domain protein, partial [Tanacetum coccineum]